jgi:uncharacterized protein (DUF4415 family)
MILDEPDEDADAPDDGTLLESFLNTPQTTHSPGAAPVPQDWPPHGPNGDTLVVDADILAWFKANHQDWQRQIRCVLRAWIAARPSAASRS